MHGFRIHQWSQPPAWEEIDDPEPGAGEVLIAVEACGVGLTVLNCINGDLSNDPSLLPRVPGHELVGRVIAAGDADGEALIGRRVTAYFYLFCGSCPACRAGDQSLCANLAGWVGVHVDGGYAPRVVLPARNAVPVPDELDPVDATVVPDAVATPVHVTDRAGIGPGDRVAVIGAGGGVGIHMIQVAAAAGATVAGLDVIESKLECIAELGAAAVESTDLETADVRTPLDGAPTVVIDLLGTEASARWALDVLDTGGRLVALTTFRDRPFPVEPRELVFRELTIVGSRYSRVDQLERAAALVADGSVKPIIGEVTRPQDVEQIHAALRHGTLLGRGAIDWRMT